MPRGLLFGLSSMWSFRLQQVPHFLHWLQVDILVMTEPSSGRWVHLDTEITNNSGRITYNVPRPRRLGVGVYPVKMVVR